MARIERFVLSIYAYLLRLYPHEFRVEFGAEMQSVFAEAFSDSRENGLRAVLRLVGGELRYLPGSTLREYRDANQERKAGMETGGIDKTIRTVQPTKGSANSWFEAFLAATPYILILVIDLLLRALVLSGLSTVESLGVRILNIGLVILFIGTLLTMLVVAVRGGWPLWSASWYPFFWLIPVLPLGWLLSILASGGQEYLSQEVILYLVIPMMIAALLYSVTRTDRLRGMLAALPILFYLWLPNMEQTPNHIIPGSVVLLVKTTSTLLITMAVMAIVRIRDWRAGYWIILGTILLVGMQYAYVGIYHGGTLPFTASGPSLVEVVKSFIPQYLAVCAILLGPLFGWMFRKTGRRSGSTGKIGYHLALLGLLLIIAVNLLALMFGANDMPGPVLNLTYSWLVRLVYVAILVYLLGLVLFYLAAWRFDVLPDIPEMILLGLLPMAIPLMFVMPFITWKWPVSQLYGIPVLWVIPDGVSLAAGLVWLLLSSWLVTRKQDVSSSPVFLSYETH